jgi:phage repressor protein C with HTH and peptisase S24 domain
MTTPEERLKEAREKSGFDSASGAAEAMGVPVATYIQHENGGRGFRLKAERYAQFFRVTPEWLLYGRGKGDQVAPEPRAVSEVRRLPERPIDFLSDAPKMPLLGTALGADDDSLEEDIELTELHLGDVLDYVTRPASLVDDKQAYALTIVGNSMMPRFKPGERVAVSPKAPVSIGDDVIVQLRGEEDDAEKIKMVLIKELVRRTAGYVELRQYNPEMTFRIEAKRVAAMHKVRSNFF